MKNKGIWLSICFTLSASVAMAEGEKKNTKDEVSVEKQATAEEAVAEDALPPYSVSWSLGNAFGTGNFVGRTNAQQSLSIGFSYFPTMKEILGVNWGANGEFFTRSNGNLRQFFYQDPTLSVTTFRLPKLNIGSKKMSFIAGANYSVPLSHASRLASQNNGAVAGSIRENVGLGNGFIAFASQRASYTFFKYTHQRLANAAADDQSQEGSMQTPVNLSAGAGLFWIKGSFFSSTSYTFSKSRTYENNGGEAFWRDSGRFSLGTTYFHNQYAMFGVNYSYGADPLDQQGNLRNPFFSRFADWQNASRFTVSYSGSWGVNPALLAAGAAPPEKKKKDGKKEL